VATGQACGLQHPCLTDIRVCAKRVQRALEKHARRLPPKPHCPGDEPIRQSAVGEHCRAGERLRYSVMNLSPTVVRLRRHVAIHCAPYTESTHV
jgi:hypothetical protein